MKKPRGMGFLDELTKNGFFNLIYLVSVYPPVSVSKKDSGMPDIFQPKFVEANAFFIV